MSPAPTWAEDPVPQLAFGRPGKDGFLHLHLRRDPFRDKLSLAQSITAPLQIGRLLYPDASLPEMAYCYAGDADRWFGAGRPPAGSASHWMPGHRRTSPRCRPPRSIGWSATVRHSTSRLVWDRARYSSGGRTPLIPFRGSRLWQEVNARVDPTGMLLYGDLVVPGRTAGGEHHDYDYYRSRVTLGRAEGAPFASDTQMLAPAPPTGRPLREAFRRDCRRSAPCTRWCR